MWRALKSARPIKAREPTARELIQKTRNRIRKQNRGYSNNNSETECWIWAKNTRSYERNRISEIRKFLVEN